MKKYAGKYELLRHENFAEYFKQMSPVVDDDVLALINRMEDERNSIEIKTDGGDNVLIISPAFSLKVILGQPCTQEFFPGVFVRCTSAFAGNVLTIGLCLSFQPAPEVIRDFTFTDDKLTVTYTGRKTTVVAKSIYTKI
ncbi:hypothetical protein Trydic_g6467 [Trypoxylus dichotomus]